VIRRKGYSHAAKRCPTTEAAKLLRIGRNQGYDEAAKSGELPTIKIGKRILVPRAALERMLKIGGPKIAA
jgi:excisionase family DNA binding protein